MSKIVFHASIECDIVHTKCKHSRSMLTLLMNDITLYACTTYVRYRNLCLQKKKNKWKKPLLSHTKEIVHSSKKLKRKVFRLLYYPS